MQHIQLVTWHIKSAYLVSWYGSDPTEKCVDNACFAGQLDINRDILQLLANYLQSRFLVLPVEVHSLHIAVEVSIFCRD